VTAWLGREPEIPRRLRLKDGGERRRYNPIKKKEGKEGSTNDWGLDFQMELSIN